MHAHAYLHVRVIAERRCSEYISYCYKSGSLTPSGRQGYRHGRTYRRRELETPTRRCRIQR